MSVLSGEDHTQSSTLHKSSSTLGAGEQNVRFNMFEYVIKGRVLPIRATLSFGFTINQKITDSRGKTANVEISIYSNELTVYYNAEAEIDIYDLRNLCLNIVNGVVATIGFYSGIGWSVEISQVLNRDLEINEVYGANISCLSSRNDPSDFDKFWAKISIFSGKEKRYLDRCFSDLQLAITHPLDTPFYCYRAIESLRHLCGCRYKLNTEKEQWDKLSTLSGMSWDDTALTKNYANDARHGDHKSFTGGERQVFFEKTWELVENFIEAFVSEAKQ